MKNLFLFIASITIFNPQLSFGQESVALSKFYTSLSSLGYPMTLSKNCIPTNALLQIKTNGLGKIESLKISDTADLIFKIDFSSREKFIKKDYFSDFVKEKKLVNKDFFIPLFISFTKEKCSCLTNSNVNYNLYYQVEKQKIDFDNVVFLKPLMIIYEKDIN